MSSSQKIHAMKSFSFKILPVVQQQAEPTQRVQRRIIAAKLVQKLADILPSTEYDQFWKKDWKNVLESENPSARASTPSVKTPTRM
jgi:hypothetical protein